MYKRYERQNDAMGDLPHGLSWQEYQAGTRKQRKREMPMLQENYPPKKR